MKACEWCGSEDKSLIEIDNSDPEVGWYDTMSVCEDCAAELSRARGLVNVLPASSSAEECPF